MPRWPAFPKESGPKVSYQAGIPWQWPTHGTISHGRHVSPCAGSCAAQLHQHGPHFMCEQLMQNIYLISSE